MSLRYLSDAWLAQLRKSIPQNAPRYLEAESWLEQFAVGGRYSLETGIDVGTLPALIVSSKASDDAENAVRLFGATRMLTPLQAMDERLWAYLTHVVYWKYMVERWGVANPQVIMDRFFLKGGGIGSLVRNGISRLWWSGFLTYDAQRADPFELTRVLLSKQDIHTGLLQRALGKSRSIRQATLEYLASRAAEVEQLGGWSKVVQKIMVDLNTAGGVYLLDALSGPQIESILNCTMESLAA